MNQKLYMIIPNKIKIRPSGPVYNDDICEYVFHNEEISKEYLEPIFFDNTNELKKWFLSHVGWTISKIYLIEYLTNFENVSDVIKISDLNYNNQNYYTAVNKNLIIKYIKDEKNWQECNYILEGYHLYYFSQIYQVLQTKGFNLDNVYINNHDRISSFDILDKRGEYAKERNIWKAINSLRLKATDPLSASETLEEKELLKDLENLKQNAKLVRTKPIIYYPDNSI